MNEIIPAKSISKFQLNWSLEQLMQNIDKNKIIQYRDDDSTIFITYDIFRFWISKEINKVIQIGVYHGFTGDYNGITIGSTLTDVKEKYGSWDEGLDVYLIPKQEGLCFELEDNPIEEEWIEEKAPIGAIYVFNPDEFDTKGEIVYNTVTGQYIDKRLKSH